MAGGEPDRAQNPWLCLQPAQVPVPPDEPARLAALRRCRILDTGPEPEFDRITRVAAQLMNAPVALISLVDAERQWFKARLGLDVAETPRRVSFCQHTILGAAPLVVTDAATHPLFHDNPLVTGAPGIRFYAGAPLIDQAGYRLGSLCVLGMEPRAAPSNGQLDALCDLAAMAADAMQRGHDAGAALDTELALRAAAIDRASDGIAVTSRADRFAYANDAFAGLFGYSDGTALLGVRRCDLLDPAEAGWLQPGDAPAEWRGEILGRRRDGQAIEFEASVTPIPAGGVILIVRDIAARRQAERRARELEAELMRTQKMEALGLLAGGLAHEINTPVQYVGDNLAFLDDSMVQLRDLITLYRRGCGQLPAGEAQAIVQAEGDVDLEFLLDEIPLALRQSRDGVARVRDLVSAIKRFSHPGPRAKTPSDLAEAINLAIDLTVNQWKYVADVERRLEPGLPLVECDIGEINQVVVNLIVNAAHAIEDRGGGTRGRITVSARQAGDQVEVSVADTGTGIPDEHRSRIFELFYTTKPIGRGTGQGLALCRSVVVKDHHGDIAFDTEVGVGSCFRLTLPIRQPAAAEPAARAPAG